MAGRAGERFGVRNSGATAVIEGAGDHCCEYMTGGTVIVLGQTGWNLGAGMTGGEAFVWDLELRLPARVNPELVDLNRLVEEDIDRLKTLIQRHHDLTGSRKAAAILNDWPRQAAAFCRIAPKLEVSRIEGAHEGSVEARH